MAKVLVVDDHPDIRNVLREMLLLQGHSVHVAESGEEAWKQLLELKPDAVVVDQRLPGISGIDLLIQIRQAPQYAKVAVVICSGDDGERDAARLAGADDFWLKGSATMFDQMARLSDLMRDAGNE